MPISRLSYVPKGLNGTIHDSIEIIKHYLDTPYPRRKILKSWTWDERFSKNTAQSVRISLKTDYLFSTRICPMTCCPRRPCRQIYRGQPAADKIPSRPYSHRCGCWLLDSQRVHGHVCREGAHQPNNWRFGVIYSMSENEVPFTNTLLLFFYSVLNLFCNLNTFFCLGNKRCCWAPIFAAFKALVNLEVFLCYGEIASFWQFLSTISIVRCKPVVNFF